MNSVPSNPPAPQLWLGRYAKIVVLAAFWLIFTGGHTTTAGAGMAFPDWPLSNGSLNPEGWLTNFFMLLEHGHRLTAGLVAALVTVLFTWVWRMRVQVPSAAFPLALWAVIGVFSQALLGGLRVILDPQGIAATTSAIATTFRVLHGCFAQVELCLLVALATILSPIWGQLNGLAEAPRLARAGWITVGFLFLQLIVGATMRHLGAGLAIPTFPQMPGGGLMPKGHNVFVDLNFTHTRFGALLVTLVVVWFAIRALRAAHGEARIIRPALLLLGLLVAQLMLGMLVIWQMRPLALTTLHVVNGAALLATTVCLVVRASRGTARLGRRHEVRSSLVEAAV